MARMTPQAIERREKATRALALRARGMPWERVAQECGYKTAHHALIAAQRLNARTVQKDVEFSRSIAVERLENLMRPLWVPAMNPALALQAAAAEAGAPAPPGQLAATEQLRKLLGDLAEIEGSKAPRPIAVAGPDSGPIKIEGQLDVRDWPNPDEEYLRTFIRVLKEAGLLDGDDAPGFAQLAGLAGQSSFAQLAAVAGGDEGTRLLGSGEGDPESE